MCNVSGLSEIKSSISNYFHNLLSDIIINLHPNLTDTLSLQWRRNGRDSVSNHQLTIVNPFIQTQIKENFKAPRHWPLCGEFTGDRWIPRTNGQ